MEDYINIFKDFKQNFYNEYKLYNLNDLCLPLLEPIFNSYYANWNPFKNRKTVKLGFSVFKEWKAVLEDTNSTSSYTGHPRSHTIDSYHRLVWQCFMPPIRRAFLAISIRNYESVIDFIDTWTPLLPGWIIENIFEQLVLPKLNKEVDEWNPLTDTTPIHRWMHPWVPYLKDQLEPLYAPIRHKISNALINWHPSDDSAKAILLPWHKVFSKASWDTFMINNILPKLKICLNEFKVNPRQQELEPWKWVMQWENLIPSANFVSLLETSFFSNWLQVLSVWLNSGPNYDEVSRWYVNWKNLFSSELLENPTIKAKMTQALVMMNKSVSGATVSFAPSVTQAFTPQRPLNTSKPADNSMIGVQITANPSINSFKDMIEKKASEHNILFLPVPSRMHEGKQIYRLGNLNIYLDRNVIFCLKNGYWAPASINQVIEQAL
jgi:tuftelin-interacting protein 11